MNGEPLASKSGMNQKSIFKQSLFWGLISGILVGTSYMPFWPWALPLAYLPLWISSLRLNSISQIWWQAWVTQFTLTLIGFHWVGHTAHEFGQMPWALSILVLLIFSSLMHIYIPLAQVISLEVRKRFNLSPFQTLWIQALVFSLCERLWPSLFPWHLGYTLLGVHSPVSQWADLIGFEGLSTLIFLSMAFLGQSWIKSGGLKNLPLLTEQILGRILVLAVVFGGLHWGGRLRIQSFLEDSQTLSLLVVQGNIGNFERLQAEQGRAYQTVILERYLNLTQRGLNQYPETDLILWPETAYPDFLRTLSPPNHRQIRLRESLKVWNKPLITGAFSKEAQGKTSDQTYNGLFLWENPEGTPRAPYNKTHLLAFGEYLPGSETFPSLKKLVPMVSNFGRGQGPELIPSEKLGLNFGSQICYEGLYPSFSNSLARLGADVIVNVTNDSWFGDHFEPYQHLSMTLARAIETRRPLVRVTNTGISTAIQSSGEILTLSPLNEEWFGLFKLRIPKSKDLTFFTQTAPWQNAFLVVCLILVTGFFWRRNKKLNEIKK